jgi:D-aminopeptidase
MSKIVFTEEVDNEQAKEIIVKQSHESLKNIQAAIDRLDKELNGDNAPLIKKASCELAYLDHFIEFHLEAAVIDSLLAYKEFKNGCH